MFGIKYNERTECLKMKNGRQWQPNYLGVIIYSELLSIKDENELLYYVNIAFEKNSSKRELRKKIKNKEYERLPIETKIS